VRGNIISRNAVNPSMEAAGKTSLFFTLREKILPVTPYTLDRSSAAPDFAALDDVRLIGAG
jgi:hypothetical protein